MLGFPTIEKKSISLILKREKITGANVNKLFNFWQQFASLDEQTKALRTLKVKADASRHEITRSYRELASRHHPDKGGDTETFIHIRQAYELLR